MMHATYRLQLSPEFGFEECRRVIPYLVALGVDVLYVSPIFEARQGSAHGYDVTNPTQVRRELGGSEGLQQFMQAARSNGMSIMLDIVPNHMAAHQENPWWWDVLKHGRQSSFAQYLDIDWEAGGGRVILPVLGRSLDESVDEGALRLAHGSPHDPDEPVVCYYEHRFPVQPGTLPVAGDADMNIRDVLDQQAYSLRFWRDGVREINYRRFFDVNELIGIRVEDEIVFQHTHELILDLADTAGIEGLRVDHIDGLRTPHEYLARIHEAGSHRHDIHVEKILAPDEPLNTNWPVKGTTGYEFLNRLNAVFVDPRGFGKIHEHAVSIGTATGSFVETQRACKRYVLEYIFIPEIERLVSLSQAIGTEHMDTDAARCALIEFVAALDVYRTYITDETHYDDNITRIDRAHHSAREACLQYDESTHAALDAVVHMLRAACDATNGTADERLAELAARMEQLSGAAMAKGHEDTALYRFISLTSLNEVGGVPVLKTDAETQLHEMNVDHAAHWPGTLNATATHDTKRGEDTRMRINVLSEIADEWTAALERWHDWHASIRTPTSAGPAPSRSHEVLCYQSLLGIWPTENGSLDAIATRLGDYLVKAAREGKQQSNWYAVNEAYERALHSFCHALLIDDVGERFRNDAQPLIERVSFYGAIYSLAQVAIKAMSPGVPDFYQGTELWDLVLVDPDNRRAVDFDRRRTMLNECTDVQPGEPEQLSALLNTWRNGSIKLFVTHTLLSLRAAHGDLFASERYQPLTGRGTYGDCVFGFARHGHGKWVIVIAPKRIAHLTKPGTFPLGESIWRDTALALPDGCPVRLTDVFTNREVHVDTTRSLHIGSIFSTLPLAVLVGE